LLTFENIWKETTNRKILETSNTTENMTAENMLDVQETTVTEIDICHTQEDSFDLENVSTAQDILKVLDN